VVPGLLLQLAVASIGCKRSRDSLQTKSFDCE
jgi:hypothetical protein